MSFHRLGLSAKLLRAVDAQGYKHPTPVQSLAIPPILLGDDLMARAQTGTGKTAGFTLPLLQRLNETPRRTHQKRHVRALILTPTRELAAQVHESVRTYGRYLPLSTAVVFGGGGFRPQAQALRRGVDVLVSTPGRLLDHIQQRTADLSGVEVLVLDEADRMLDMGFLPDIRRILAKLPTSRQNLLFSATLPREIRDLADRLLNTPSYIEIEAERPTVDGVSQIVHPGRSPRKEQASELSHRLAELEQGARLYAHQAGSRSADTTSETRRDLRRGDSRRQDPKRPHAFSGRLQARENPRSRGNGHRRKGTRYRRAASGRELRAAARRRGLCAPYRAHGARRAQRRCRLSRLYR